MTVVDRFDILSTFDFGPLLSTRFIDFAVAKFLHEEDPTIRCAAALCCCNALSRVVGRADAASLSLRNHILERCLVLGATDLDVDLRTRHAPPRSWPVVIMVTMMVVAPPGGRSEGAERDG